MLPTLPFETQFKILSRLPTKDVLSYCSSNVTAYNICQTNAFWNYKAQRTFGINLSAIDDHNKSPRERYEKLEDLYYRDPRLLIVYLVRSEQLSPIPMLLKMITNSDLDFMDDVFQVVVDKDSEPLMLQILTIFRDVLAQLTNAGRINDVIRYSYFKAILSYKRNLASLLRQYYDPDTEDSDSLLDAMLKAMETTELSPDRRDH